MKPYDFSFTTEEIESHRGFNFLDANDADDADLRLRCVSDSLTRMTRMTRILGLRYVSDSLDAD